MKAEIMTVTPEMAKTLLNGNLINRKLQSDVVNQYANDMLENKWTLGGIGISISKSGFVLDGQHRLHAIVKANVPVQMLVCTDIEDDVANFDTGKRRSLSDWYKLKTQSSDSLLTSGNGTSFIRACYETDVMAKSGSFTLRVTRASYEVINEYVTKNKSNLQTYFSEIPVKVSAKGLKRPVLYAFLRAVVRSDKTAFTFADYSHFCHIIQTGCIIEAYDAPIIALRDKLMILTGGGTRVNYEIRLRTAYAVKQYLEKSTIPVNKMIERDKFSLADFI